MGGSQGAGSMTAVVWADLDGAAPREEVAGARSLSA